MTLNCLLLIDDVCEAIFSLDADSAAGTDGFSSLFCQHCWNIIHDDVYSAIIDFFEGGHLLLHLLFCFQRGRMLVH